MEKEEREGIAIIGMSCRFPKACNIDEFWYNIKNGVECLDDISKQELLDRGVPEKILSNVSYIKRGSSIADVDKFDAEFFSISPKEAALMDPQQRLFLEHSWKAFEDAGYNPEKLLGKTGVFGGVSASSYFLHFLVDDPNFIENAGGIEAVMHGFDKDYFATKVAYKLNLTGPSMTIQTACSSSLVAVATACQSLMNYQCDMAIAGGTSVIVPEKAGYHYKKDSILSSDGYCRPFSDDASGTVFGSGVGCVLLKRLDEALEDDDHIYAVIKGFAINNDGADRMGYTAPSMQGQYDVILQALELAGVNPETIGYMEAHGTGTKLGDPIEFEALTHAYGEYTDKKQYCALGSVKANIGHLNAASGIAGLIKSALILKHRTIPPLVNFSQSNRNINLENSPFYINVEAKEWTCGERRRLGLSSFGIGGTNAHLVVEECLKDVEAELQEYSAQNVLVISAKTADTLNVANRNLYNYIRDNPGVSLDSIARTLQVGRKHFGCRNAVIFQGRDDLLRQMKALMAQFDFTKKSCAQPSVVFVFPNDMSEYKKAILQMYNTLAPFKEAIDECRETCAHISGAGVEMSFDNGENDILHKFCVQYAMAKTLISIGVDPESIVGNGLGEFAAICIAGIISLHKALELIRFQTLSAKSDITGMLSAGREKMIKKMIGQIKFSNPAIEIVSGVLKSRLDNVDNQMDDNYWSRLLSISSTGEHLHYFVLGNQKLYIEIGGGDDCGGLIDELISNNSDMDDNFIVSTFPLADISNGYRTFLYALSVLWERGCEIQWDKLYTEKKPKRISLPTYPFQKSAHWISQGTKKDNPEISVSGHAIVYEKHQRPDIKEEYRSPDDPVQHFLVDVWEELLGIEGIGINDNFFALGGHSLMATQLMSRISEQYPVEIDMSEMFNAETIYLLAETIKNKLEELLENISEEEVKQYLGAI